jgi:hypothetical protein
MLSPPCGERSSVVRDVEFRRAIRTLQERHLTREKQLDSW